MDERRLYSILVIADMALTRSQVSALPTVEADSNPGMMDCHSYEKNVSQRYNIAANHILISVCCCLSH